MTNLYLPIMEVLIYYQSLAARSLINAIKVSASAFHTLL